MKAYEDGDYFGSYVVLDFETTNNQFGNPSYENRLLCAVWYFSDTDKMYYEDSNYKLLLEHLWSAKVLVAHNAKFELKWLYDELGAFLDGIQVFDPMLAQYALDGVERHPVNLGALCRRYNLDDKDPYVDILMKSGVCPSEMPRSLLRLRCIRDVRTTQQLYHILSNKLLEQGLMPMYHTKAEFCKVLADIELNGMHLDKDMVQDIYIEKVNEFEKVEQELAEFTGGINHNSPKQKQEYLYDVLGFKERKNHKGKPMRTSAGGRLTDSATIARLEATTDKQAKYLELLGRHAKLNAELTKALSKFYECSQAGELLYADFNQHVTKTHRLSSSGTKHKVQFQNMQREFKKLFSARTEGWGILEADGAQLEFRVAGFLGCDAAVREAIRAGEDTHQFTADTLTESGQPTDRQGAKAHTFKPLTIAA